MPRSVGRAAVVAFQQVGSLAWPSCHTSLGVVAECPRHSLPSTAGAGRTRAGRSVFATNVTGGDPCADCPARCRRIKSWRRRSVDNLVRGDGLFEEKSTAEKTAWQRSGACLTLPLCSLVRPTLTQRNADVSKASFFKYLQLTRFAGPARDRRLYRQVCTMQATRIVEIGLGNGGAGVESDFACLASAHR